MSENSKISWTDATWNPLRAQVWVPDYSDAEGNVEPGQTKRGWACVRVSEGCVNCYAATFNRFRGTGLDYTVPDLNKVDAYLDPDALEKPLHWRKPRRVFVCSMTDLFGEWVTDEEIDSIFAVMALTPQHTYLVLTKRAERMQAYMGEFGIVARWLNEARRIAVFPPGELRGPLPNVQLGVSAENQARADERVTLLLDTPAAVRWVSVEPQLGPMSLTPWLPHEGGIDCPDVECGPPWLDWIVVGGESGPVRRPFDESWGLALAEEARRAGVPAWMKQAGGRYSETPFTQFPYLNDLRQLPVVPR